MLKKALIIIIVMVMLGISGSSTELVFDKCEDVRISIDLINSSGLWEESGTNLQPQTGPDTLNLRIPTLTNCDTIDTDGSGVFSCGTDGVSGGEDPSKWKLSNFTLAFGNRLGELWNANNASNYLRDNSYLTKDNSTIIAELMQNDTINRSIDLSSYISDASSYQKITDIWKLLNFTTAYDLRTDRFLNANYTALEASAFDNLNFTTRYDLRTDKYSKSNYSAEYSSTGWKLGNSTAQGYLINGTDANLNNLSVSNTNTSFGSLSIIEYNSSCSGFRTGATGGGLFSCT